MGNHPRVGRVTDNATWNLVTPPGQGEYLERNADAAAPCRGANSEEYKLKSYKSLAVTGVIAAMACSGGTTAPRVVDDNGGNGIVAGSLQISVKAPALHLKNQTEYKVGYLVVEKGMAVVAMIPPCNPGQCNELVQGAERAIAFADIPGFTAASKEATVYWWKWVPGASGLEVSGFTSVSVRLQ
jgi:hypothetical protein